jgi:photosystem II stability/assembly factor-like uncharacterized protein
MRRFFILCVICSPIFFSCKKNNVRSSGNAVDTLATGWKKVFFVDPANLIDIFFVGDTGFTISSSAIYRSLDAGNNWTRLNETAPNFQNMGMGSTVNAAFIVAPNFILSTHTAGASFDTTILADNFLTDVFFVSPSIAYAAGKNIWKTTNGGVNWTKLYTFTTDSAGYKSLYFISEQTGWVVRRDGLYATFNGGAAWNKVPTNGFDFSTTGDVFFRNSTTGFISDEVSFGKTNSGGASWTKTFTGMTTYHDIHFVSDNIGYLTDGSRIYKSTDGGSSWKTDVFLQANSLSEIHFTDANHGWACGNDGLVLKFNQ